MHDVVDDDDDHDVVVVVVVDDDDDDEEEEEEEEDAAAAAADDVDDVADDVSGDGEYVIAAGACVLCHELPFVRMTFKFEHNQWPPGGFCFL